MPGKWRGRVALMPGLIRPGNDLVLRRIRNLKRCVQACGCNITTPRYAPQFGSRLYSSEVKLCQRKPLFPFFRDFFWGPLVFFSLFFLSPAKVGSLDMGAASAPIGEWRRFDHQQPCAVLRRWCKALGQEHWGQRQGETRGARRGRQVRPVRLRANGRAPAS